MKVILKYELKHGRQQFFKMPAGAEILSVQGQHDIVVLWALCEPGINEVRCFFCYPTGVELPANPGKYLGTAQLHLGRTVVHVFEEITT